jgi:hypothetical protein
MTTTFPANLRVSIVLSSSWDEIHLMMRAHGRFSLRNRNGGRVDRSKCAEPRAVAMFTASSAYAGHRKVPQSDDVHWRITVMKTSATLLALPLFIGLALNASADERNLADVCKEKAQKNNIPANRMDSYIRSCISKGPQAQYNMGPKTDANAPASPNTPNGAAPPDSGPSTGAAGPTQ